MSNLLMNRHYHATLLSILLLFTALAASAQHLPDFTGMVEQNSPAVVNISTKKKQPVKRSLRREFRIPGFPENSPFDDFFRRFEEHKRQRGEDGDEGEELSRQSLGSGFIITSDGYIMTNNHVVEKADEVIVRLSDRREFEAEIIGRDKQSDTAILKIDAKDLPTVKIGKSSSLKVGEWVLAIGSPFGFDHTVTAGIVSAKGRSLPRENYVPFIQTDVAINPGNSGGPLFNLHGEVVGVNSQIYSRTGGFMGLSFAIPIEVAMNVADQLRTVGKVSRGWLGVLIQDVTKDLADSFGMKKPSGALVSRVVPDSPAEDAKLMPGDVILEFNGNPVKNSSELPPMVGSSPVEKSSRVTILRQGKRMVLNVTIGELPSDEEMQGRSPRLGKTSHRMLGIKVKELTEEQQERMQLKSGGVIVTRVSAGAGRSAGIRRGDVIQMINSQQITSIDDFKQVVEELEPGKSVAVLVLRYTGPVFLALKIPEK
jgi:serine protease Do